MKSIEYYTRKFLDFPRAETARCVRELIYEAGHSGATTSWTLGGFHGSVKVRITNICASTDRKAVEAARVRGLIHEAGQNGAIEGRFLLLGGFHETASTGIS